MAVRASILIGIAVENLPSFKLTLGACSLSPGLPTLNECVCYDPAHPVLSYPQANL